jgi:hypothetical protein
VTLQKPEVGSDDTVLLRTVAGNPRGGITHFMADVFVCHFAAPASR